MPNPETYSIEQFANILPIEKVTFDVLRFDEFDAKGSGQDLTSELADPKWTADVVMRSLTNAEARQVAALARKRFGSQLSFMLYDPSNPYPYADPEGAAILAGDWIFASGFWNSDGIWYDHIPWASANPEYQPVVADIGLDNQSFIISGLPANYILTAGDKGQIVYGDDDEFNFYFEFSETLQANTSGILTIQIYPHVPPEIEDGAAIILIKPACKMTFDPSNTFQPGQSSGNRTGGVRFSCIERV